MKLGATKTIHIKSKQKKFAKSDKKKKQIKEPLKLDILTDMLSTESGLGKYQQLCV